ncbi:uncharacterized protein MKZ38_002879 [Zalerion maritima]|uniref:Uncharacterized protein n=1 Tax=Zalerion maritima TaxID=339359 RepID=A0AAD5RXA5_9PEZI|nr:uncharacterized protein MKZ38_002879 [Zalerion maritima]
MPSFIQFVSSSFLLASQLVAAQTQNLQFNQVANINGDVGLSSLQSPVSSLQSPVSRLQSPMQFNQLVFPDNSKIETFSQTQRQILVNQNPNPLAANHVVGSTGQPFVQLSQNSMTIDTNNATDLVGAQIELPIDQGTLDQNQVTADNTFVAMLSPDRQAWIIVEGIKSVNTTDSTVRMIKLNNIDGEYMAVGRQTIETSNVLTPFGSPQAQPPIQITGSGIQEVEYTDGFRMSIDASQPMTVNVDVVNGVSASMITDGSTQPNDFRYLVTTSLAAVLSNLNDMMAVVQIPLNADRAMQAALAMGAGPNDSIELGLAQRGVIKNPGGATGNLARRNLKREYFDRRQDNSTATTTAGDAAATGNNSTTTAAAASDAAPTDQQPADQQQATQPQAANPAATQLLLEPTFTPITSETLLDRQNMRVAATVNELDGEFIVTMQIAAGGGAQQQQQPGEQPAAPAESVGGESSSTLAAPAAAETAAGEGAARHKRQEPLAPSPGTPVTISMAELQSMAESQKTGNVLAVWSMMSKFRAENPTPQPTQAARNRRRGTAPLKATRRLRV